MRKSSELSKKIGLAAVGSITGHMSLPAVQEIVSQSMVDAQVFDELCFMAKVSTDELKQIIGQSGLSVHEIKRFYSNCGVFPPSMRNSGTNS